MLVSLPRGCFAPYTDAKTGIIYLTDKAAAQTDWFYRVTVRNDGFDSRRDPQPGVTDLDRALFFYSDQQRQSDTLPASVDISVIAVRNLASRESFSLHAAWRRGQSQDYAELRDVASIQNGQSITAATTRDGDIPVIAGGRGTSPYTHAESNAKGRVFTISKSGAYAGYVWWHDDPIWASDCIVVKSNDEDLYLTRYLYLCMALKQDEIYARQQGTGQPHIYISHIRDFPVPVMPIQEQHTLLREYENAHAQRRRIERKIRANRQKIDQILSSRYEQGNRADADAD